MQQSFVKRLLLLVLSAVAVIFLVFSLFSAFKLQDVITTQQDKLNAQMSEIITSTIENTLAQTQIAVETIANNQAVAKMFAERDREGLLAYLMPVYEPIKGQVAQFQFHLPDSTSFLRLHKPEKFGDSLKEFRYTVNEANAQEKTITGIEQGVAGYGLRVVVPVEYQGQHIGTVEFGNNFDLVFLEGLKSRYGNDYSLYAFSEDEVEGVALLASTMESEAYESFSSHLEAIMDDQRVFLVSDDQLHGILMVPFRDFSNAVKGFIVVTTDYKAIRDENRSTILQLAFFALISMVIIAVIIYLLVKNGMKPLYELQKGTKAFSDGDLTVNIPVRRQDEFGLIASEFNDMTDHFNAMMVEMLAVARDVETGSENVEKSSLSLSQGATQQASTLEEVSASMETMATQVVSNSQSADEAKESTLSTQTLADQGYQEMTKMLEAMENINLSSNQIGKIIKVIDDIAFQTNILALNAAVEAARAGKHGKGFAVVAEEVRNLATKSAEAARETAMLIEQSKAQVHSGTNIADSVAETFNEIVENIRRVNGLVINIAEASAEQSLGIEQLHSAVSQIADVVQNTSNVAEDTATSSERLSGHAAKLRQRISNFKIDR